MENQFGESGVIEILTKLEPLTKFFHKLDQSDLLALVFALAFLTVIALWWYWVFFKNGAEKWRDGIIAFNRRFGVKHSQDNLSSKPIAFKIFITIMLFAALLALSSAILSLIG